MLDGLDVGFFEDLTAVDGGSEVVLSRVRLLEGAELVAFYTDRGLPAPQSDRAQVADVEPDRFRYAVSPEPRVTLVQDVRTGAPTPEPVEATLADLQALLTWPGPQDRPGPVFRVEVRNTIIVAVEQLDVEIG